MDKRVLIAAVIIVIIAAGIGGYYLLLAPPGVPNPDTLVIQTAGEPDLLDPALDYETAGVGVLQQVYETLVWYKGNSTDVVPWLASSWELSDDGLTYTFHLRQGIKFHSGDEFNAYAVKYSLERAVVMLLAEEHGLDGPGWILAETLKGGPDFEAYAYGDAAWNKTASKNAIQEFLDGNPVEVVDNYTVKIHLQDKYAGFLPTLAFTVAAIVNPVTFGKIDILAYNPSTHAITINETQLNDDGSIKEIADINQGKIFDGTGAFKIVEWKSGTHLILEANPDYWGGPDNVKPKLNRVIIQYVDEFEPRKNAFLAGEADIVYWPTLYADQIVNTTTKTVLPDYQDKVRLMTGPTFDVMFMGFNLNETISTDTGVMQNPFVYKDVRLGFSYAFPYTEFIDTALQGFGLRAKGPIPQGMFGFHNGTLDDLLPTYNLTKAKELLSKFTWTDDNNTIVIYYNQGNDVRKYGCLMLKNSIESIDVDDDGKTPDIKVVVTELAWPQYLSKIRSRSTHIFFVGWAPDYADPDNYAFPFAYSRGTFAYRISYNNTEVDQLYIQAKYELNRTKRAELYLELQRKVLEDAPYIWLYQGESFHLERTWVHGWYLNPVLSLPWLAVVYKG